MSPVNEVEEFKSELRKKQIEIALNDLNEYSSKSNDISLGRLSRQIQSSIECFLADSNDEYNDLSNILEQEQKEVLNKDNEIITSQTTIDSLNVMVSKLKSTITDLTNTATQANREASEYILKLTKDIESKDKKIASLNDETKDLNEQLKSYTEIKAMGGPSSVIKKIKEQKASLLQIKKKIKQTKGKSKSNEPNQAFRFGKGVQKLSYSQLEYAYQELEMLFQSAETKLIDAQFQLASQEDIVSMFSYKNDFLFTFPNLLVLGVDKNDKGNYNKKQMHRTLLYLSHQGVGGLLYLDDNDQVQMMSTSETEGVVPNNETSIILAKAWLKKLKLQQGKLRKEDLDLANFLNTNRSVLPSLLNKEEILKLPDLVRCNKVKTKNVA